MIAGIVIYSDGQRQLGAGYRRCLVVRAERRRATLFEPGSLAFQTVDASEIEAAPAWPYDAKRLARQLRRRLRAAGGGAGWFDRKRVKRVLEQLAEAGEAVPA